MVRNVGSVDRLLRAVLGIALLVSSFTIGALATGWGHWVALAAGIVMILTAAIAFCPAYLPLGLKTCRSQ